MLSIRVIAVVLPVSCCCLVPACGGEGGDDAGDAGGDSGGDTAVLYAGAARRVTTPGYFETYEDLNGDFTFDGRRDDPDGGDEPFDDANGNGIFDTHYLGGKNYNRALNEVHDDTEAKALVLSYVRGRNRSTVALVGLDAVGYFNDEVHRIEEELDADLGIDLVLVGASHGHETIDTLGIFGPDPVTSGVSDEYNAFIREQIVDAIEEAARNMVPARVSFGEKRTGIEGFLHDGRDPVIIEDTMAVMDVRSLDDGSPIAFFVNWHCHPETLSTGNLLTRDWVGYMRDEIEEQIPGTQCVFFNGLVGGQIGSNGAVVVRDGAEYAENDFTKMEMLGKNLADHALSIELEEEPDPEVSIRTDSFFLPVDNTLYKTVFKLGVIPGKQAYDEYEEPVAEEDLADLDIDGTYKVKTDLALLRIGDALFLSLPGEMHPELAVGGYDGSRTGPLQPLVKPDNPNPPDLSRVPSGPYLVERMAARYRFFLGLSGDYLGYIIPEYNFQASASYISEAPGDHYEETNSIGPEFAPVLVDRLGALLEADAAGKSEKQGSGDP